MDDKNYRVTLRSYVEGRIGKTLASSVKVECESYETFKKIINAVKPIIEKEEFEGEKKC